MTRCVGLAVLMALAACRAAPRDAPVSAEAPLVSLAAAAPAGGSAGVLATGTVRAKRETALAFNTNGRVAAVLVDSGDRVAKGQLLARLDPVAMTADDAAARAELVRAEADYKRLAALQKSGWVAKSRVETAQAAASAARARVAAMAFNLRYAAIYAPSAGTVLRRQAEAGQIVAAGTPVVTLGEAREGFVLRAPLPDSDLAGVRVGQFAAVTLPALGRSPLAGRVDEVAGRGDERTGTFEAVIALPAAAGLRSGLIGDARIATGGGRGTGVTVPAAAIWQARADEGFVYVVDKALVARARMVQLGPLGDRDAVVTSGLAPGERVAVGGIDRVRNGGRVRVK